jgi:hypothetical protein
MSTSTSTMVRFPLAQLVSAACGRLAAAGESTARRTQLALGAALAALVLAGLWGAAAASSDAGMALANLFKVPLVVAMSALCALPAGMLAMRIVAPDYRAGDVALAMATSVLGGCLVLGVLAPLVAIYYHTSARFGVQLSIGSVLAAVAVGAYVLQRNLVRRAPTGMAARTAALMIPAAVLMVLLVAALVQFVALASPILAAPTAFDGGIDTLLPR